MIELVVGYEICLWRRRRKQSLVQQWIPLLELHPFQHDEVGNRLLGPFRNCSRWLGRSLMDERIGSMMVQKRGREFRFRIEVRMRKRKGSGDWTRTRASTHLVFAVTSVEETLLKSLSRESSVPTDRPTTEGDRRRRKGSGEEGRWRDAQSQKGFDKLQSYDEFEMKFRNSSRSFDEGGSKQHLEEVLSTLTFSLSSQNFLSLFPTPWPPSSLQCLSDLLLPFAFDSDFYRLTQHRFAPFRHRHP